MYQDSHTCQHNARGLKKNAPESHGVFGDVADGPMATAAVGVPPMGFVQQHVFRLYHFGVVGSQRELFEKKKRGNEEERKREEKGESGEEEREKITE